jgi:NADH-quinone oxidoreductase subunit N
MMLIKLFQAEIFFCLMILLQLIFNTHIIRKSSNNFPILTKETTIQPYILLFIVLVLLINLNITGFLSNNLFYCDQNTQHIKILFLITILLTLPFIKQSLTVQKINYIEFDTIFLLSVLSGLLLISASDLLVVYILIEMQSLCFYILASFKRNSAFSTEAGMKYFIFGSIISCLFLLALGILYGITGTLNFHDLNILFFFSYPNEFNFLLSISIFLITVLFLFKLAVVPFHFWAPDVYEGSPLASTIIFSIFTKPVLIHLFMKWIFIIGCFYLTIKNLLVVLGVISLAIGTFLALKQKRLKKLIIYSSIAQIGFLILSISLNNYDGFIFCFFFLIIYLISSILIWGNISLLYNFDNSYNYFYKKSTNLFFFSDLKNLFEYNTSWGLMIIIIFFSISGIPPLVGFLAKIFIILELVYMKLNIIAILIVVLSSISIFYYIRILKVIYFESTLDIWKTIKKSQIIFQTNNISLLFLILVITQSLLIITFYFPDFLIQFCNILVLNSLFF